jgi:phasin protein
MSTTKENKPVGKSGRRGKKGEQRRQKPVSLESPAPVQMQSPEPDHRQHLQPNQAESAEQPRAVNEPVEAVVTSEPVEAVVISEPIESVVTSPDALPAAAAAPAPTEPAPVSLQTIANAYRDYTRKSFEEIGSYFEQLTGVRSLDKAMKVQTDFMKRAYETSVAESQRICELHNRFARQTFQPFQGLMGKTRETHGKS